MIFVDFWQSIEPSRSFLTRVHVFELVVTNDPRLVRPLEHGGDLLLGLDKTYQ